MARIEKDAPMKEELARMKGDIVKKVKKTRASRPRHPFVTCGIIALGVIGLIVFWFLWSLAATGLVSIPGLSAIAYREPEPTRIVMAGSLIESEIESQLTAQFSDQLMGGEVPGEGFLSLLLSEESLTATLQSVISSSAEDQFDPTRAQIAVIEDEGLEVFLPLANNDKNVAVTMILILSAEDDQLTADIERTRIGNKRLPQWVSNLFVEPLVLSGLQELNEQFVSTVDVEDVRYFDGDIEFQGRLYGNLTDLSL